MGYQVSNSFWLNDPEHVVALRRASDSPCSRDVGREVDSLATTAARVDARVLCLPEQGRMTVKAVEYPGVFEGQQLRTKLSFLQAIAELDFGLGPFE